MKIIIDIPDKEMMQDFYDCRYVPRYLKDAIKNGIPLDDVKAEIADIPAFDYDTHKVRTRALEILDNIGKESEEE